MPIREDIIGTGWRFPIRPDARGRLGYVTGPDSIEQSLKIVLLTFVRERVMRPDFGSKVRELVFAPGSEQGLRLLESSIGEAIRDWEPRVDVLDIVVQADADEPSRVVAEVSYQIRATYVRGNLVFPFYLEGAGGTT
jgi:Bacteriophage baseplate protein W